MEKLEPHVKIQIFKDPKVGSPGGNYCVQEVFAGKVLAQRGDTTEINKVLEPLGLSNLLGAFDVAPWSGQPGFTNISSELVFLRFTKDGRVWSGANPVQDEVLAGFAVKPQFTHLNCVMNRRTPSDPQPRNEFRELRWRARHGTDWDVSAPPSLPLKGYIAHRTHQPGKLLSVETIKPLQASQGFCLTFDWLGFHPGHKGDVAHRVTFGGGLYSIVWRRPDQKSQAQNSVHVERRENGQWVSWRQLDVTPTFEGRTTLIVQPIAGYMVITIDADTWYLTKVQPKAGPGQQDEVRAVSWPKGRLEVAHRGVSVLIGALDVNYLDVDNKPMLASFERLIPQRFRRESDTVLWGYPGGWFDRKNSGGPYASASATLSDGAVKYLCTLYADTRGQQTPLITNIMIPEEDDVVGDENEVIDLRFAAKSLRYSGGEPDSMPTAEIEVEFDRWMLDTFLPEWPQVLSKFRPISVEVGWSHLSNDGASIVPPTEWTRLFDGYILDPAMSSTAFNTRTLKIVAQDPRVRVKEPAGFVDEKFAPLDLLHEQNDFRAVYGGECVKELLRVEFGEATANQLNGNGDPMAFFDAGHFPVFSSDKALSWNDVAQVPLEGSGFRYPPLFGRYLSDWIDVFCQYDFAVFFWSYSPLNPTAGPVPIYGRLKNIIAAMGDTVLVLPDAIYEAGDSDNLIGQMEARSLTDKAYNKIVVWGSKPEGTAAAIVPSLFTGQARVSPVDPNSPEKSWLRTKLVQQDVASKMDNENFAQQLADLILLEFEGYEPRDISLTLPRGNETIHWGMKVQPKLQRVPQSDSTIALNDIVLRVKRIEHSFDLTGENPEQAFTTQLSLRPLSPSGF